MRVFIYMFIYMYPCTHTHTDNHICMYMLPHAFLLDQIVGGGGRSTHLLLMGARYNWLVTNCSCKCSVLLHQTHACCSSWQLCLSVFCKVKRERGGRFFSATLSDLFFECCIIQCTHKVDGSRTDRGELTGCCSAAFSLQSVLLLQRRLFFAAVCSCWNTCITCNVASPLGLRSYFWGIIEKAAHEKLQKSNLQKNCGASLNRDKVKRKNFQTESLEIYNLLVRSY